MATFVLIHGASVGGWSWKFVAPLLRREGHDVYAPTLTGLGERVHLGTTDVDLDTHINDIASLLWYEDLHDVILVGWSYGGTPVTGAADRMPERISQLVYLDADVPRDGETSATSPVRMDDRERYAREHGDGWRTYGLPPEQIAGHLQQYVSQDLVNWTVERLAMQSLKTWTQPLQLTRTDPSEIIPHVFIYCTVGRDETDPDVIRARNRIDNEVGWTELEIAADHFAPITAPGLVSEALLTLAGGHSDI